MKFRKSPVAIVAVVAVMFVGSTAPALAATASPASGLIPAPASSAPTSTTVIAPMTIDCAAITAAGLTFLQQHHVAACGLKVAGVTPDATGYAGGNCGTTSITINNLGGGKAHLQWGFSSKWGPVTERDLEIWWYNWRTDKEGSVLDLFPMLAVTYVSKWYTESTGTGSVEASMEGEVTADGLVPCTIDNPSASATIS